MGHTQKSVKSKIQMKTAYTKQEAMNHFLETKGESIECIKTNELGGLKTFVANTYNDADQFFK